MNSIEIVVRKLKLAIAKLERQINIGRRNARWYILRLVDALDKLAAIEAAVAPAPLNTIPVAKSTPVQLNLLDFLNQQSNSEEVVNEQLDSFPKLKEDVCSQLNEAAWRHLQKWACDPYRRESNEWWYLSKLRPESQPIFKKFQDRYEELELADFRKDEEKENARLAALPEISDNEKARRDFGFGFLPNGMF